MSTVNLGLSTIDNLSKTCHGYYMERKELFQNKYQMRSNRCPGYDYSRDAAYFITICTKNRIPWFGKIRNRIMGLSKIGCVVADEWQKTALIRNNVILDYWIIMPNHFHAIIIINTPVETSPLGRLNQTSLGRLNQTTQNSTKHFGVGNELISSQSMVDNLQLKRFSQIETPQRGVSMTDNARLVNWKSGCLGSIVNQFKGACTKRARNIASQFQWQPRFYDRIIKTECEMDKTRDYIIYNPMSTNS